MSADRDIDGWLKEAGYGTEASRQRARQLMEQERLTRPGKQRISEEKLPRVQALLSERFYLACTRAECQQAARADGREVLVAEPRSACERCGGSDNRRAEVTLLEACQKHGIRKLVIVGGSPSVREELDEKLGDELELRMVDGTERRTGDRAKADLEWADLVLVWGASELHHKVSTLYMQSSPALRQKVIHVARRGVAALLSAAVEHLQRR